MFIASSETMRAAFVILAALLCSALENEPIGAEFEEWMREHGKSYESESEYQKRLEIYSANAKFVEESNAQGRSYQLHLNKFADLTFDEFTDLYLSAPQDCSATRSPRSVSQSIPSAIDWRDKGVVTPVKNQGQCGSCWTFSTTGCLESHHAIKTGKLISLYDEDGLQNAVGSFGPVSIAFDVDAGFQMYHGGVYSSLLCSDKPSHVNHAVLAVGYNQTENGEPYWIVKNSWGADWGLKGYFWIERGKNMCGLADCASYPIV